MRRFDERPKVTKEPFEYLQDAGAMPAASNTKRGASCFQTFCHQARIRLAT